FTNTSIIFVLLISCTPLPTLYPYTTLFRSNVEFHFGRGHQQCLRIGVNGDKLNAAQSDIDHSVDSVHAAAADTNNFDDGQVVLRSEEHTSELQSRFDLVCRLLLEKKNNIKS